MVGWTLRSILALPSIREGASGDPPHGSEDQRRLSGVRKIETRFPGKGPGGSFFIGEGEIGLLDIVLMDAISSNVGAVKR
jgi:hypothetical protein